MIIPLSQNMDCGVICKEIEKIIRRYANQHEPTTASHALSINVVKVTESDCHIPKLEHKE